MKPRLYPTDYVLYDRANDHVVQFSNGDVIIYGFHEQASEDCRGNEEVISCTELNDRWKEYILNQLKK